MKPLESDETNTPSNGRTGQAYILFAISLILVVIIGSTVQFWSVLIGLGITELALILLPAIVFVYRKRLPVAKALGWRPISPLTAVLSIAVGITSWAVAAGMFVLSQPLLGDAPTVDALAPRTLPDLLWVLFFAALLPGFCEETLFRGAIQGVLRRKGQIKSVVITALLFAVFHVNPWILLSAFFLGIVFGILVVKTGSTVPAIIAHIANNATAFTVTYFYHDQPESKAYLLMAILAAGWCVVFSAFWIATRRSDPEMPVLATVPAEVARAFAALLGLLGGCIIALIAAAVIAAFMLVGLQSVTSDRFEPEIHKGDQLVMFKSGLVELDLEAGDVVSLDRDGEMVLRKIVKLDRDSVWIDEEREELRVARKEITGKVVHVIRVPDF